jgi:hypothetical protein
MSRSRYAADIASPISLPAHRFLLILQHHQAKTHSPLFPLRTKSTLQLQMGAIYQHSFH